MYDIYIYTLERTNIIIIVIIILIIIMIIIKREREREREILYKTIHKYKDRRIDSDRQLDR